MSKKPMLGMAVEHPYYCNERNYYSNDPAMSYETMTEFLDDWQESDIDMNLVFRWDLKTRGESGADAKRYYAEVFIMHQRKGIFMPIEIKHVNEDEMPRFKEYLEKHLETLRDLWKPLAF